MNGSDQFDPLELPLTAATGIRPGTNLFINEIESVSHREVDIQSSFDPESMTLTIPLLIGTFMYDRSLFGLCLNLGKSKILESNLDIILHIMFQFLDILLLWSWLFFNKSPFGIWIERM
jgi:hypothetical protein